MIDFKFNRGDRVRVACVSGWTFQGTVRNRRISRIDGSILYDIDWQEDGKTWTNIGVREHEITKI